MRAKFVILFAYWILTQFLSDKYALAQSARLALLFLLRQSELVVLFKKNLSIDSHISVTVVKVIRRHT